MAEIRLTFSNEEMIEFLHKHTNYRVKNELRQFRTNSILDEDNEWIYEANVHVVHKLKHGGNEEVIVPDEKDFIRKSNVLQEVFTKELKKKLLSCN